MPEKPPLSSIVPTPKDFSGCDRCIIPCVYRPAAFTDRFLPCTEYLAQILKQIETAISIIYGKYVYTYGYVRVKKKHFFGAS